MVYKIFCKSNFSTGSNSEAIRCRMLKLTALQTLCQNKISFKSVRVRTSFCWFDMAWLANSNILVCLYEDSLPSPVCATGLMCNSQCISMFVNGQSATFWFMKILVIMPCLQVFVVASERKMHRNTVYTS